MTHPTDALRLVPVEPTEAMCKAARYSLSVGSQTSRPYQQIASETYRAMLSAAPASPLPEGGGWKPSRNDVARRCDPKAWEFYDRHIDNPIMGAECRAEVAASIRMADAILALPAAPTGEPK